MIRARKEGFKDSLWKNRLLQFGQLRQILLPYPLAEAHVTELPFAAHLDQSRVMKFLEVVGAGRRGDAESAAGVTAAQLALARNALQNAIAFAIGDRLADAAELARGHSPTVTHACIDALSLARNGV